MLDSERSAALEDINAPLAAPSANETPPPYSVSSLTSALVPSGSQSAALVIRLPAPVEVDRSVKFPSDQTAVRCVLCVGFGWPHPASIIRSGIGGKQKPGPCIGWLRTRALG